MLGVLSFPVRVWCFKWVCEHQQGRGSLQRNEKITLHISAPTVSCREDEITMFIKCLWEVDLPVTVLLSHLSFSRDLDSFSQSGTVSVFLLVFLFAQIICFYPTFNRSNSPNLAWNMTYWCMLITIAATNCIVLWVFIMLSHATCLHNRLCVWLVCDSSYLGSIMRQADSRHENSILWNT